MHDESSTTITGAAPRNGVLVLTGYGVRVAVERGHLVVSDGTGRDRRQGRFPRTARDLRRLVIIGHTGTISFDALRWLHDVGCAFVQLDADGQVIVAAGPAGLNDARLRRAQALAATNEVGLAIARELLSQKLAGQAAVLQRMGDVGETADQVRRRQDELTVAATTDQLRMVEARAALAYWGAWASVPVRFARKAAARVPDHWRTFGTRHSPLTGSPRMAATPANAILNYCYAIAEAKARIAALAVGLDPGMGVLHADQRGRDSLACDLMEAIRPDIDAFVLELLEQRPFGAGDFFETRQGACRLMPSLTRLLAETGPRWAKAIAPIAEQVAQSLMTGTGATGRLLPTPLTQANRSAGRDGVRTTAKRWTQPHAVAFPTACRDCGVILDDTVRQYCDECLPDVRAEAVQTFSAAGPKALAELRAQGADPAHGGMAGKARGKRDAAHVAAATAWEREHDQPTDATAFARDILPHMQGVPLRAMAEATGLSEGYCSFVRRGQKVPHRRHWATLVQLSTNHRSERQ